MFTIILLISKMVKEMPVTINLLLRVLYYIMEVLSLVTILVILSKVKIDGLNSMMKESDSLILMILK
jgi:hypothetical protein